MQKVNTQALVLSQRQVLNQDWSETVKLLCNFIGYRSKESSGWMFTVKQIIKTI